MNRFKQKLADYDEDIWSTTLHAPYKIMAYKRKGRLLSRIFDFAKESNTIEGIFDDDQHSEAEDNLCRLLGLNTLTVSDLCSFNKDHGTLRTAGQCVTVGNYMPPKGGQNILYTLESIIQDANDSRSPYQVHQEFEALHPFTDGNGRTGRAIWLWQMVNQNLYNIENLFLHQWYYQSLSEDRK